MYYACVCMCVKGHMGLCDTPARCYEFYDELKKTYSLATVQSFFDAKFLVKLKKNTNKNDVHSDTYYLLDGDMVTC